MIPTRSSARRRPHPVRTVLAALVLPALLLSGCGTHSDEKRASATPSMDLPTGSVDVPDGVTLTKAGTVLDFGETATVAYEPNTQRSSVIAMSVDSVQTGRIADFAAYQMDAATRASTPYYVRVTVRNVGNGDLGNALVPLLAVDTRNTLIQPSNFNNEFARCPSKPLPAGFTTQKSVKACLVYLVPAPAKLTEMSFRPVQAFEPILWRGTVQPPAKAKKADHGDKAGKKGHKKGQKKP